MDHVFGYCCFNNGTLRDFQMEHSLTAGKNFQFTGSVGPWITTSDEAGEPAAMEVVTRLNDVEMQRGKVADLIFDIPALV